MQDKGSKERLENMKTFLCEYIHPEARKVLESFSEIVSDWERLPECDAAINRNLQMTRMVLESAKKKNHQFMMIHSLLMVTQQ